MTRTGPDTGIRSGMLVTGVLGLGLETGTVEQVQVPAIGETGVISTAASSMHVEKVLTGEAAEETTGANTGNSPGIKSSGGGTGGGLVSVVLILDGKPPAPSTTGVTVVAEVGNTTPGSIEVVTGGRLEVVGGRVFSGGIVELVEDVAIIHI